MNNLAFQIYGSTKSGIFQSTWDTTLISALGSETAAISASGTNWALNTGATNLNVGGYKHTTGSTTNLTTTLAATIMQMYQITYTISSRTAGSVTINYGGVSTSGLTTSSSVSILAIATTVFSITPTSDFDGVISISVKQTSSATNQIKLPLPNTGTYNIWVDWGDGTYNNITSYNSVNTLHTYPTSGIYTVRITGNVFNWTFSYGATNDRLKIKTISTWGKIKLGGYAFQNCSNLTLSGITDILDLSTTTSLTGIFFGCSAITTIGRINEWTLSTITDTYQTFCNATSFNQYIGSWNVSNVTNMYAMFQSCSLFNNGYASGVEGVLPWTTTNLTSASYTFNSCTSFNQCIGGFNVSKVTNFQGMLISCAKFNNGDDSIPLNTWTLNTTSSINMVNMLYGATIFNRNLNSWNTSKVNTMTNLFLNCTVFNNGYTSGTSNQLTWDISTCTDVSGMFQSCTAFNSNLGTGTTPWDVSKVTTFVSMFQNTTNFNNGDDSAPINNWSINTVSSVIMASMFSGAVLFNRPIDSWNTTRVVNMNSMFGFVSAVATFNQNIGSWDVSSVTNMSKMFLNARFFNNGGNSSINSWNTLSAANMSEMFRSTGPTSLGFNQPIGNWNTSNVTDMSYMFQYQSSFNQDIGLWNVSKISTMYLMFDQALVFNNGGNSSINNWNPILCSNMYGMFSYATAFNQPIGNWNVSNVTNFTGFMQTKTPSTYSSTNLDAIYNGWSTRTVKPSISISFGTAKYSSAGTAGRLTLTSSPNNWAITDGGQLP